MNTSKKIIHIDDDPDIINICRRVLEFSGFNVTAVTSFDEVKNDSWKEYDLLIVDWMVPYTNAVEMYDKARGLGFQGEGLVLTAREMFESEREQIARRSLYYMRKPFGPSALIDTVTDIFARKTE